ncbi:MAG: UDP-4-amino-4,6-dideoxy-N-acetyl-beta-L-altrosamine N-acetyltransferase [Caulobacterales bacterium 68-7]|nr:MAG: UDP-4-amino-4,6-dideoxy-N-acetyl-beta-L-altrosamine N-acetyltransferase [Caulobacterales bacterium 68-7]
MYTDHVIAPDEHARWFAAAVIDPTRRYWIIEADGQGVGLANLYDIDTADRRATWAYYIADPSQRGRGVGAMAEFQVIEQAFGALGLARLACEVLETNPAVIKLHKRFGFVETTRLVGRATKDGQPVDAIGLELTADAWAEAEPAMTERLRGMGFPL